MPELRRPQGLPTPLPPTTAASGPDRGVFGLDGLQALLDRLKAEGYRVLGPTLRDHAILYDDIDGIDDLPRGWTDEQEGGHYRLKRRDDEALFGYAVGPQAWKRFLHAPQQPLWRAKVTGQEARLTPEPLPTEKLALIGVRGCEAAAIAIQDRVLLGGAHRDPYYGARREGAFLVAVNCGTPAATCFCTSMGTGPAVGAAHDLVLTELLEGGPHRFLAAAGSAAGRAMLATLPLAPATDSDLALAGQVTDRAAAAITRRMPTEGLRDLMLGSLDHPRWDDVAERCLTCGNCTMACPTCFCTTAQDANDLVTGEAVRSQHWASCFAVDFAYIHGGSVRPSPRARYRQWITHKLGTWWDQFDSSGCVGCGRCITWCPVGIDITEEVAALRGDAPAAKGGP